ncbi:T9SS type A sorting domain-containing protein [Flavobacterium sp.]|uniref:T9SS type A sorting domain-containing protein n=1 Tax=Flavobacterium sp. TaxID=239 RepID=UPI0025D6E756|nr:T9SS type A sorting domain-containing protein [Flavobacterium sp.]
MKKLFLYFIAFFFYSQINYSQVISIIGNTSPIPNWNNDTDLITTDNINYTLTNVELTSATGPSTGIKFRQDHQWTINWGGNFPNANGTQNGPNIQTVAGTYDITFNRTNGTYTFILSTGFPSIGIWGPAVNSQIGYAAPDVDMTTTDGIIYTLSGFYFSSGNAYFRQNNATNYVWGSTIFPSGTATLSGPSLFIPGNEWFVTFNRNTGAYSFTYPSIGILGTALNGFTADDIDLSTTDGFNYSISNLTFTDGLVKFRKDNLWTSNWGSSSFPTGTGTQAGANIPVTAGTYNVMFEKTSGNYSFTNALSITENSTSKLKIYPNPTNAFWNISNANAIDSIELFDLTGKTLQSFSPSVTQFQLDGNTLSSGVYFVKIKSGLDFAVQKIIKN